MAISQTFSIWTAIVEIFKRKRFVILFLALGLFFFWLFLYIPVRTVPGNDFNFQLSLLSSLDIGLLITVAVLTSLSLVMNIYMLKNQFSARIGAFAIGQSGLGSLSGIVASLFGTATCAVCIASLLGFLGVGGIFFLLQYRQVVTVGAIILLLISLHFTAQKVLGICEICKVDYKSKRK